MKSATKLSILIVFVKYPDSLLKLNIFELEQFQDGWHARKYFLVSCECKNKVQENILLWFVRSINNYFESAIVAYIYMQMYEGRAHKLREGVVSKPNPDMCGFKWLHTAFVKVILVSRVTVMPKFLEIYEDLWGAIKIIDLVTYVTKIYLSFFVKHNDRSLELNMFELDPSHNGWPIKLILYTM